jgi:hypothetical protein
MNTSPPFSALKTWWNVFELELPKYPQGSTFQNNNTEELKNLKEGSASLPISID